MNRRTGWGVAPVLASLLATACSTSSEVTEYDTGPSRVRSDTGVTPMDGVSPMDVQVPTLDVPALDRPVRDVRPNYDAFFADNPAPRYCGPDGAVDAGVPPDLPGGTPECPDDLMREGCSCFTVGETRPCWPGLRINRNRGQCQDGTTRCVPYDELSGRWGPCEGYVLPTPGATRGPAACQCFSQGRWEVANLSPCFIQVGSQYYAVSTYLDARGQTQCPTLSPGAMPPFQPQAGQVFSTNALTVDCTGQFELCYTIKAGDPTRPAASDCVLGRACTTAWYGTRNARQTLPPLPSWTGGADGTCATRFQSVGGYGEMSVRGLSSECENIGEGTDFFVFNRVTYCPLRCNTTPTLPECARCGNGGSGNF